MIFIFSKKEILPPPPFPDLNVNPPVLEGTQRSVLNDSYEIQKAIKKLKSPSFFKMSEIFHHFITGGWKANINQHCENFRACSKTTSYVDARHASTTFHRFIMVVFDRLFKKIRVKKEQIEYSEKFDDSISGKIKEARNALADFNLQKAKQLYLEIVQSYNQLPKEEKSRVYKDIIELYNERKAAEGVKII